MSATFGMGPTVRHNFRWDMISSIGAGLFTAFTLNFVPVVARRAEADAFVLSLILAAPFAGNMLAILSSYLLPRQHRHQTAAHLIAAARGVWLLAIFTTVPLALTGMVLVHWVLLGIITPILFEVIREMYPRRQRGRLISLTRLGLTGSMTLGSLLGGFLLDVLGPGLLLPLGAIFGVAGALAWGRVRVSAAASEAPLGMLATIGILRQDRPFAIYTAGLACWGFGLLLPGPLYPILLVDRFQATYTEIGALGFITSAAWLAGYLSLSRHIDRFPPLLLMALSFALCLVLPLGYILSPSVWFLAPGSAAVGFASAGLDLGGIALLMRYAPPARLSEYTSLLTSIAGVRGLVAPFVGSALVAIPWLQINGVLALAVGLIVLGAVLLRWATLPHEVVGAEADGNLDSDAAEWPA